VRYLSTTTQAITPSQGTVSWNTLDANTQQDLGISGKNRIINGNMVINQRAFSGTITGDNTYTLDRYAARMSQASKYSVAQSSVAPAGFTNSLLATSLSSYALTATDFFGIQYSIEGYNIADLGWGTANGKTVTLSFWVNSSLTGTFGGQIFNNASSVSSGYTYSYTITAANTWQQVSITVPAPPNGTTWGTTNSFGIVVWFNLGTGTTYSTAPNVWNTSFFGGPTGNTSVVSTNGATFYITGVMLEVGTQATTFTTAGGSYGAELALCQRYYYQVAAGSSAYTQFGAGRAFSTTGGNGIVPFPVPMRTAPTFAFLGVVGNYDFSPTAIASGAVPASNTHMTVGMTFSSITSGSMFWLGQNASSTPCGFTFSSEL
jgi:hypothetical protein